VRRPLIRSAVCLAAVGALLTLGACEQKQADAPLAVPPPPTAASTPVAPPVVPPVSAPTVATVVPPAVAPVFPGIDVGKLETVKVTSDGFGSTASEAVAEAMRLAILQVNGASLDMTQVNTQFGLDAAMNQTAVSMRGAVFSDGMRQRSGGVIQNFKIVNLVEPPQAGGKFKASIEAGIAKFNAPAELKKIKLAIAPLRFDRSSIPMGDRSMSSSQVGAQLKQRIQDSLAATGRFSIVDRDFSPEIEAELDLISGGSAPRSEMAKLGQTAVADIIWIGKINGLAYNKSVRQLQTSDRQLVSYSGGWSISEKLVNVATRQVIASESLRGSAPSTEPTTLSRGVNSGKVLGGMTDDLVNQVVASILARTFPITVVQIDGINVVLSQGGQGIVKGTRYAVVTMGAEIKDPQTGQSLGRIETPCCEVVVERVTQNLSFGRLENATAGVEKLQPGSLVIREKLKVGTSVTVVANKSSTAPGTPKRKASRNAEDDGGGAMVVGPPNDRKNDDKW
jgi:curli biogenesis system outer membrane secretion channel CsgG